MENIDWKFVAQKLAEVEPDWFQFVQYTYTNASSWYLCGTSKSKNKNTMLSSSRHDHSELIIDDCLFGQCYRIIRRRNWEDKFQLLPDDYRYDAAYPGKTLALMLLRLHEIDFTELNGE